MHQFHPENKKYLRTHAQPQAKDDATLTQPPYEAHSYLQNLTSAKLNKLLMKLKKPLETDQRGNIIDLNWSVDWIMKNSQSYNKETGAITANQILTGSVRRAYKQAVTAPAWVRTKAVANIETANVDKIH